jgi:NADPH:quinone reductase
MRAVRVHQHGAPEVMKLEEVDLPQPGPGELLVRVRFAGVNYADLGQRRGGMGGPPPGSPPGPRPTQATDQAGGSPPGPPPAAQGPHAVGLPYTPGFEVVGTVAALGPDVSGFELGQRVVAVLDDGGYAEFALSPVAKTYPAPDGLGDAEASLMLVQGLSAYGLLHDAAQIRAGEWVLVEAAAGGVGSLAAQLARAAGARVVGAVGGALKREQIGGFGLDLCVDYTQPGWERSVLEKTGGVNVLLESVGGAVGAAALQTLAPFGRVVLFGGASGQMLPFPALMLPLMTRGLTLMGFNPWLRPERAAHNAQAVAQAIVSGAVKPRLQHFGLAQVQAAHRAIEERRVIGKVVLDVSA